MLPTTTSQSPNAPASRARPSVPGPVEKPLSDGKEPLSPIGPERLRALRQAIEDGTYPREADVLGGLERLLGDTAE